MDRKKEKRKEKKREEIEGGAEVALSPFSVNQIKFPLSNII